MKAAETHADLALPGQALLSYRWTLIAFPVVWIAATGAVSWLACRRWLPTRVIAYNISATLLALTLVFLFAAFGLMGIFAPLNWGPIQ